MVSVGQLVQSRQGRDRGRMYFVIDILENDYVELADGKYRKINNPKIKKIKHLNVYNLKKDDIIDKLASRSLDDAFIKKTLKSLKRD